MSSTDKALSVTVFSGDRNRDGLPWRQDDNYCTSI